MSVLQHPLCQHLPENDKAFSETLRRSVMKLLLTLSQRQPSQAVEHPCLTEDLMMRAAAPLLHSRAEELVRRIRDMKGRSPLEICPVNCQGCPARARHGRVKCLMSNRGKAHIKLQCRCKTMLDTLELSLLVASVTHFSLEVLCYTLINKHSVPWGAYAKHCGRIWIPKQGITPFSGP